MSPLFFNLVGDILHILINQFQEKGWVQGISISCLEERISILQFADDMMLFLCRIDDLSSCVRRCLTVFSMLSGLTINLQKSIIIGVGRDILAASQIASENGCRTSSLHVTYLGLPLGGNVLNCNSWNHVIDIF